MLLLDSFVLPILLARLCTQYADRDVAGNLPHHVVESASAIPAT